MSTMSKNIKVTDDVYERLYDLAIRNGLSLGKQINSLMDRKQKPREQGEDEFGLPVHSESPKRFLTDILADIDVAKKAMEEELSYCQDSEARYEIKSRHSIGINKLWDEYNEAKNGR